MLHLRILFVLCLSIFVALPTTAQDTEIEPYTGLGEDPATMQDDPPAKTEVYVIPSDAVAIDAMPEDFLQFNADVQMPLLEGWQIYTEDDEPYIKNSAVLLNGTNIFTYNAMLTIIIYEEESLPIETYQNTLLSITAMLYTGHRDFDAERDLIVEELSEESTLTYLNIPSDAKQRGNIYTLTLDNDLWISYTLMIVDDKNAQQYSDETMKMILNTIYHEREEADEIRDYVAPPADISGIDPSGVIVYKADCFTQSMLSENDVTFALYECPKGCANNGGRVWGTDIYTNDSSVCVAAIHAGITTNKSGGRVLSNWLEGQSAYTGSVRNNVETSDYGSWGSSYDLQPLPDNWDEFATPLDDLGASATDADQDYVAEPSHISGIDPTAIEVVEADCNTRSQATEDKTLLLYECPANCAKATTRLWGSDIYTHDSSVCLAAIHAGVIQNSTGGQVIISWMPGQPSYESTTRNGVKSTAYGSWHSSFEALTYPENWR